MSWMDEERRAARDAWEDGPSDADYSPPWGTGEVLWDRPSRREAQRDMDQWDRDRPVRDARRLTYRQREGL